MPFTNLIPTKLRPPRLRDLSFKRPQLLDRLSESTANVILVHAPAGWGKTNLLAQWALDRPEPVAWLSLTAQENNLARFVAYLSTALGVAEEDLPERVNQQAQREGDVQNASLSAAVHAEVARSAKPWTLILDDYHVVDQPDIHAFINGLIDVIPDHCRLIIGSRTEPPIAVARRRLSGELDLLGVDDLAVKMSECAVLFTLHGMVLSHRQLIALTQHTAGWLVALHCVILACKTRTVDDIIDTLQTTGESLDILHDYLFQEILDQLSPELRRFILQTSILDRFTADVCQAVTSNPASGQLVEQARRSGLFLNGLDDVGLWYRFHHLFGEFLSQQLQVEEDPAAIRALHAAASGWFKQHNLFDESIAHAVKAEDWSAAAELITTSALTLLPAHRIQELWSWVEKFPRETVVLDPNLSSIVAWGLSRQGRAIEAEPFMTAAEAHWSDPEHRRGLALVAMARASGARFRDDGAGMIHWAAKGIELATGRSPLTADGSLADDVWPHFISLNGTWMESEPHIIMYYQLAVGLIFSGRLIEAESLCSRILDISAGSTFGIVTAEPTLALLRFAQGRLEEAESIARPYALPIRDHLPTDRVTTMQILGEALYEWNLLDEAEHVLRDGLLLMEQVGSITNVPALCIQLARVLWAKRDVRGARLELDRAAEAATALRNVVRIREIDAYRARLALSVGDTASVRSWLIRRGFTQHEHLRSATFAELAVYARHLISSGESDAAIELLDTARVDFERTGRVHDLLRLRIIESLAYLDLYELDHAVAALSVALEIAEDGKYFRSFIDEGEPLYRLMRVAHRRGVSVGYIREVLVEAGQEAGDIVRVAHREIAEPITSREIEVLRFIALGLTNKEISEELYLSVATVKRHITNLYGKLDVASRTEAVQRARKLGILTIEGTITRQSTESTVSSR